MVISSWCPWLIWNGHFLLYQYHSGPVTTYRSPRQGNYRNWRTPRAMCCTQVSLVKKFNKITKYMLETLQPTIICYPIKQGIRKNCEPNSTNCGNVNSFMFSRVHSLHWSQYIHRVMTKDCKFLISINASKYISKYHISDKKPLLIFYVINVIFINIYLRKLWLKA